MKILFALVLVQLVFVSDIFSAEKPEWSRIFPAGGQAGTTVEVEASGKFPEWPVEAWSDTEGIQWRCEPEKGRLKATVKPDVPAGVHWVRLYSKNGSTSVRPFVVGSSSQCNEVEPNNRISEATSIESYPIAIHGILEKKGDVDLYALTLTAGQLVVATIDAAKLLQSPVDTNLQILDSNGFVLAENLDHVGLDPYIAFNAPRDDQYFIRVLGFPATPDSRIGFGGGNDWIYRLRLESQAGAFGPPIACPMSTELDMPTSRLAIDEGTQQDKAHLLELPARIRGVIAKPSQAHYFRIKARAGSHYRVRILAREVGSSLDATIAILDGTSKQLKQADDVANNRDPELIWDAPKDGDYVLTISDFHRHGGETFEYLAIIEERFPDFTLSIANDWIQTTIGKEIEIKVKVNREHKFGEAILVGVEGIPDSVNCVESESKNEGNSAKEITLKLKGSQAFQGPLRIMGRTSDSTAKVRIATSESNKPIWLSIAPP